MRQRKHNPTAGFSLLEVVVGIAVMGLVTAPVCASLLLSVRLNAHAQALMNARLQAAGAVETLLAEGIDVNAEDDDQAPLWTETAEGSWSREMDGVDVTAAEVEEKPYYAVTVSCTVHEETVTLTTYVREGGGT